MYNSLSALPTSLYKILEYLVVNNENIWKMLKYNSYDALSKPNLTVSEKLAFLWKTGPQEKYGMFLTNLVEDAICESKCIFKLYNYHVYASPSEYLSTAVYEFDFLYGGTMALVDYNGIPTNRGTLFIHEILSTLNGVYIGGVGKLIFNDDQARYDAAHSVIGNSKTFTGVQMWLSTQMGDSGTEVGCGD